MIINDLQVWCVPVFGSHPLVLCDVLDQLHHELLGPMNVFALVWDRRDDPIRIAELPILAGALELGTAVGVQVHQVNNLWTALRADEEPRRAIVEPAHKRLVVDEL